jgi:hypothetical protein
MAEQPTFTQGLTSVLTPLATVGAGVYQTQTKSQINTARIRAGKQPCTGQFDQPSDCPSIFAPQPVTATDSGTEGGGGGGSQAAGISPVLIVGLLLGAGIIVMLLMSKKPAPASAATPAARRRRKKSKK